jgi:hypothetical protein
MDKQTQIQMLNEVLAIVDDLGIKGRDSGLVLKIKENVLTIGNAIAQELQAANTQKQS